MALTLFALSATCLLLTIHPFVTYPLTLYAIRRWYFRPLVPVAKATGKRYALCVCAYNEEAIIGRKVENMLALRQVLPNLEILVYVDAATDRTAAILRPYEDRITIHNAAQRRGKIHGMNLLVLQTQADIVIFTDANVLFDVQSLRYLPRYFANPRVGCVCGHLKYVNEGKTVTATNGSLYWRLEEHIKQLESDTGSLVCADGSLYAIRRQLHRPVPGDTADDMFISMNILCDGYRVVRAPDIIAYEESVTSAREEFRRKIRIACKAFNAHRALWPRLRRLNGLNLYKYISHKLLRWLVIFWLALAVFFFGVGLIAVDMHELGLELALFGCTFLAFGRLLKVQPVMQAIDILSAFAGTGIGIVRSLSGEHFSIWAPAASIRGNARDA